MAQDVTIAGASYEDVPSIDVPTTGGGTSSFFDVSDTTATAADVASGKVFYSAAGVRSTGTASDSGGGVTTRNVVVMTNTGGTFATVCYTDAYMVPQTASGAVTAAMPVGSLVVGYGAGEPPMVPMRQSGITQIARLGTSRAYTYVYKVVE